MYYQINSSWVEYKEILIFIICIFIAVIIDYSLRKEIDLISIMYLSTLIIAIALTTQLLSLGYVSLGLLILGIAIYMSKKGE